MQRTRILQTPKTCDAILTGDWHLREDIPVCRTDAFQTTQWNKVRVISELQQKYKCPVIHSGDLFHHWKPSPWLLSKTIEYIPYDFYTIYGNHDLPQHNIELQDKCGIYNLWVSGKIHMLSGTHWGEIPVKETHPILIQGKKILVYHVMTYQGKKPWPGCTDSMGAALLRKYPEYDLILTGHNHTPFVETHQDRLLVNPGSIMRQFADQIDHRPRVYLYNASENTATPYYLPIEEGVVTREHLQTEEERNNRMEAFITRLNSDWETSLSYEANLESFFAANQIRQSVKDIIYKSMES